jgi:iron complex outermembrane receptor protein
LFELLSPGSSVTNTLNVLGRSGIIPQNTSLGNPNLEAEEADTFTVGMVIEPEGALSDLQFSIDYYRIKLNGAISNLSALNIANLCTLGNQSYCDMFTFSQTGQPLSLTAPARNVAAFENSGIDFVASYSKNLADWGGHGTVLTAFSGTWIDHAWVDLGIGSRVDRAGENGQANLGAIPRFRANLSQTYMAGPASLTAQFVYVSSGRQDNTYNTAPSVTINDNGIPAVTYVNLFGSWDVSSSLQLFATVSNVMDKDPPPVPYAVLNVPTNGIYYDKVGRAFQLGATLRF